ncbi:metalloprotease [Diaporthe australafricana]|uniref:Metalloprotease n=1 Tax=Diaporthe australafricana TaxID=127596 RepID=A0ABR3WNE8_9PEZI
MSKLRGFGGSMLRLLNLSFMGTKKSPGENAFTKYLSMHSGTYNAHTHSTSTNYHFELAGLPIDDSEPSATNPSPLKGALDLFAQFFIEPLFLESTLDRELMAVHSENMKNLQDDEWRLDQLERSLSNPAHPYSHFGTGNLDVLKFEPEGRRVNVRQKFIEFHNNHYSANQIKLVVLGREPLDVLESWVVEYFSRVEDKNLEPNRWHDVAPFGPEQLGLQVFAKPVKDLRELCLSFPFLDEDRLFESLPSWYISHLIGHEGPGSIMSHIKSKGWANGLSASAEPVCPGSPGIFHCQIQLTEEGLNNYKDILKVFFQYVALLRETPPKEWIFMELKGLADVDFRFKQKTIVSQFTSQISSVMQQPLPREWLLSSSRLRKFEPELIRQGINYLRPENLRMSIISREIPGQWEKKEDWYGTEYTCERIPNNFMKEITQASSSSATNRVSNLHLPDENQFISTNFEVKTKEVKEPALAPTIIRNGTLARIWYKKDDKFWVPKANLVFSCRIPIIFASAENFVKAQLFKELVKDALEESYYNAELACLEYSLSVNDRGLLIEVGGYNDKLSVLLEQVLKTMQDLDIKEDRFAAIKERLGRAYRNWTFELPYYQVGEYTKWLNTEHDFLTEHCDSTLDTITCEATRAFQKNLLSQMHMEVLVHGNLCKEDALRLTDMLEQSLKTRALPSSHWPIRRSLLLPPGSNYVYRKTLGDSANVNHCIEYWLYIGQKHECSAWTKIHLLKQILHEPAFNQLRTKEKLGYVVLSDIKTSATTMGLSFLIQSEKTAHLCIKQLEKLKNLGEETGRIWSEISTEYYNFDLSSKTAESVKELTKQDMVDFYKKRINPASPERAKLSVWMIAQATSDVSAKTISDLVKALKLNSPERDAEVAKEVQARLSAAQYDEQKETEGLKEYILHSLKVSKERTDAAAETWKKLLSQVKGRAGYHNKDPPSLNGTQICFVEDPRDFKARLPVSAGARSVKDIMEYKELDPNM